jgi:hypothetical protein
MIKEGYDHFEVTRQEPKVDFCEKKYVFDAARAPDAKRDPVFDASAKCPAYVIPEDVASAVREKQQRDEAEYAKLVSKGTPVARMNTGIDGGMNKIFASKIPEGSTGLSEGAEGNTLQMLAMSKAPGTIPGTVNPPKPNLEPAAVSSPQEEPVVAVSAPAASTRVATAAPPEKASGGFFSGLAHKMGFGTADTTTTASAPPAAAAATTPPSAASRLKAAVSRFVPGHDAKEKAAAAAKPAAEPKPETRVVAAAHPAPKPAASVGTADAGGASAQIAGAAPVVSSNSFDSRFSAVK